MCKNRDEKRSVKNKSDLIEFILLIFVVLCIIFLVGLTIFGVYHVKADTQWNSILEISAAMLGGLLGGLCTLLGVCLTIRKGDTDRKTDLKRIEAERKEEERKKHIPYIKITSDTLADYSLDAHVHKGLDLDNQNQRKLLHNNVFYSVQINDFTIKNVSSSILIVKGVRINDETCWFGNGVLLEKNATCEIKVTGNWEIVMADPPRRVLVIVADILGNVYEVSFVICQDSNLRSECYKATMNDGEELTGFSQRYTLVNAMLPKLINGGSNDE